MNIAGFFFLLFFFFIIIIILFFLFILPLIISMTFYCSALMALEWLGRCIDWRHRLHGRNIVSTPEGTLLLTGCICLCRILSSNLNWLARWWSRLITKCVHSTPHSERRSVIRLRRLPSILSSTHMTLFSVKITLTYTLLTQCRLSSKLTRDSSLITSGTILHSQKTLINLARFSNISYLRSVNVTVEYSGNLPCARKIFSSDIFVRHTLSTLTVNTSPTSTH